MLVDPLDEKVTGLKIPKAKDDIILNREFFETEKKKSEVFEISSPGEYEVKGVFVYGVESQNEYPKIVYRFEIDGIVMAHLGSISKMLDDEATSELGGVDVLLVPVGGHTVLSADLAVKTVAQIEPRVIIPMYYKIPGLKQEMETAEKFLKQLGLKWEEQDKLNLKKKDLTEETQVVVLKV